MERYLLKSSPTTSNTFQEDGVTVDPGTVTLTLTREDGTVIATGQPTSVTGAAARTFNLTAAAHLNALDLLTLDWFSATKGTQTTYVEVVGGFLFNLSTLRALSPFTVNGVANTTTYPTADLIAARVIAETNLENACGVSFAPRYFRGKYDGTGGTDILLPPRLLTITSVTVGASSASAGTALTASELQDLRLYPDGRLYNPLGWTVGRQNVEVKGTAGHKVTPSLAMQGALELAKHWLVDLPHDDRATQIVGAEGTTQLLKADGTFGLPKADQCVEVHGVNEGIA